MGNIRIISELYMLQLMNARIMKECMKKLLAAKSPLALEKLVKLLHIAGPVPGPKWVWVHLSIEGDGGVEEGALQAVPPHAEYP